jgi:hypothetical protein
MKSKLNETSSDRFENLDDLDFSEFEERPRRPRPKHDEVEYE